MAGSACITLLRDEHCEHFMPRSSALKAVEYFPQAEDVKAALLSMFQECTSQVGSGVLNMRAL